MKEELFRQGVLEMSESPLPAPEFTAVWGDIPLNRVLSIAAVLLCLALLGELVEVPGILREAFTTRRGCQGLEHNIRRAHTRNLCALGLVLPFLLVADRYFSGSLPLFASLPAWSRIPAALALTVLALLLRRLIFSRLDFSRGGYDQKEAVLKTVYTGFLLIAPILLLTAAAAAVFRMPDILCRNIMAGEIIVAYTLYIIQCFKNINLVCTGFTTILYLCALEMIPLTAAAAACMFLRF